MFREYIYWLIAATAVLLLVPVASAQLATDCTASGEVCAGKALTQATNLGSVRRLCFQVAGTGGVCQVGNDAPSWEVASGSVVVLEYVTTTTGATPPAAPETVVLQVRHEDTATVLCTFHNGAPPSNGTTYEFYATSDCTSSGAERVGTVRLYVQGSRSGVGGYTINSDGVGGDETAWQQGAIRANLNANVALSASSPPSGSLFAYGTAGDESVTITATYPRPYVIAGHQDLRIDVMDGAAVQVSGSVFDAESDGSTTQVQVINDDLDADSKEYGASLNVVGTSTFTGEPWTWAGASIDGLMIDNAATGIEYMTPTFTNGPEFVSLPVQVGQFVADIHHGYAYVLNSNNETVYRFTWPQAGAAEYVLASNAGDLGGFAWHDGAPYTLGKSSDSTTHNLTRHDPVTFAVDEVVATYPTNYWNRYWGLTSDGENLYLGRGAGVGNSWEIARLNESYAVEWNITTGTYTANANGRGGLDASGDKVYALLDDSGIHNIKEVATGLPLVGQISQSVHSFAFPAATTQNPGRIDSPGLFSADPRVSVSGLSCTQTVYNRGETASCTYTVQNARGEAVTRATQSHYIDSQGATADTANPTGSPKTYPYTITASDDATATATGTAWTLRVDPTDTYPASDAATYSVSSLYYCDVHPQISPTLVKDDWPTPDATEDFDYFIGADNSQIWIHVEGVRLDDTEIDTTGTAVTMTFYDADDAIDDTRSMDTNADGWTDRNRKSASAPTGLWNVTGDVSFTGNTAACYQEIQFISAFTENLVLRLTYNSTVEVGSEVAVWLRTEIDDSPAAPDAAPSIRIGYVNTTAVPYSWTQVVNTTMVNVVDYTATVNGALYQLNWTPTLDGVYNVWVSADLQSATIRSNANIINVTMPPESMGVADVTYGGLEWGNLVLLVLWVLVMGWSWWNGYTALGLVAMIGSALQFFSTPPVALSGMVFLALVVFLITYLTRMRPDWLDAFGIGGGSKEKQR